jgi:hypothetical protein
MVNTAVGAIGGRDLPAIRAGTGFDPVTLQDSRFEGFRKRHGRKCLRAGKLRPAERRKKHEKTWETSNDDFHEALRSNSF